ncbi:hypothetical protein MRB53_039693 [Persea americana]|nr:hypothetical protein MRB53_039693 [Persea americana]
MNSPKSIALDHVTHSCFISSWIEVDHSCYAVATRIFAVFGQLTASPLQFLAHSLNATTLAGQVLQTAWARITSPESMLQCLLCRQPLLWIEQQHFSSENRHNVRQWNENYSTSNLEAAEASLLLESHNLSAKPGTGLRGLSLSKDAGRSSIYLRHLRNEVPVEKLRRAVPDCDRIVGHMLKRIGERPRKTESANFISPFACDKQVVGLDIPVENEIRVAEPDSTQSINIQALMSAGV